MIKVTVATNIGLTTHKKDDVEVAIDSQNIHVGNKKIRIPRGFQWTNTVWVDSETFKKLQ